MLQSTNFNQVEFYKNVHSTWNFFLPLSEC
nr:MAG TPA_asm: hypothetical protein [Caudoviricetes sp.]